jgi:SAM-dependent methyltransferase
VVEEGVEAFASAWIAAMAAADADAAGKLRAPGYTLRLPDGSNLPSEEELALLRSGELTPRRFAVKSRRIERGGDDDAALELVIDVAMPDDADDKGRRYRYRIDARQQGGAWLACSGSVEMLGGGHAPASTRRTLTRWVPARIKAAIRRAARPQLPAPAAGETAYLPYRPGESFLLPPASPPPEGPLPIPPKDLWLGYNYPVHGRGHVETMMRAVEASGLTLAQGDRILDLGCGAGRMIRHLEPLAGTCEIWGTDISAEHIFWCKRNLSPPFNFATTTKLPSLPFEDSSFALIYCGSLFTHIDDMADAWLLELHRILRPGGRLYVTIHDEHTMELFEGPVFGWSQIVRSMREQPLFQQAKAGFGMLALGRGHDSQIFYERAFFERMTGRMFETMDVIEEAYFYQTALLLRRKEPTARTGR